MCKPGCSHILKGVLQSILQHSLVRIKKVQNSNCRGQRPAKRFLTTYIVKAGALYKVQVGAYSKKDNATAMAAKLKAAGYSTYITTKGGTAVAASTPTKKSVKQIFWNWTR